MDEVVAIDNAKDETVAARLALSQCDYFMTPNRG
jgi:hypothetical protein